MPRMCFDHSHSTLFPQLLLDLLLPSSQICIFFYFILIYLDQLVLLLRQWVWRQTLEYCWLTRNHSPKENWLSICSRQLSTAPQLGVGLETPLPSVYQCWLSWFWCRQTLLMWDHECSDSVMSKRPCFACFSLTSVWVSALTILGTVEILIWDLRAALIYGYRNSNVEGSWILCIFSKNNSSMFTFETWELSGLNSWPDL